MIPDATGSARTDIVGGYRVTEGRHIVQAVRNGMESDLEAIVCCVWKPDVCVHAHMCVYHRCQQMDTPFSLDPMIAMDLVIPDATGSARTDIVGGYRVTEGRHIVQAVRNGMESDLEAIVCCVWKPDVCVHAHMCVYHRCQQMDTPFSLDPMIAMCWCTPCR